MWPDHACCGILVSGTLIRDRPDGKEKCQNSYQSDQLHQSSLRGGC
jgi:hypothetical protein